VEHLPKIVRQRLQTTAKQAAVHPDADLLTAFVERSLGKRERLQVLEHLAQCGDCREVVSVAVPELESAHVIATRRASSGWLRWPVLRWGALAVCVIVVGAAVTLPHFKRATEAPIAAGPASPAVAAQEPAAEADSALRSEIATNYKSQPEIQPKREIAAAPKPSKKFDESEVVTTTPLTKARSDKPSASPLSQVAAAPAPALPSKDADLERRKEEPATEAGRTYGLNAANEVVTVEAKAAAPAELAEVSPGKAKDESQKLSDAKAGLARGTTTALMQKNMAYSSSSETDALLAGAKIVPRWTLTSGGTLQRSIDAGKTWQPIPVAGKAAFRALSTVGLDIWVAGAAGTLYHSSDAGEHWQQVKPVAGGQLLTADIIGVEFTDAQHGKLTTATHETWATLDGGHSWDKR
jgi:hypothetical protein